VTKGSRSADEATLALVSPDGDRPSPVALTQHTYFNLDAVHGDVREHRLRLRAGRYMPADGELLPLAELADVEATGFDFRACKRIAEDWLHADQQRAAGGYDHAFLLDAAPAPETPVARLWASDATLAMSLHTDAPALQLSTGQSLAGTPSRDGGAYGACAGVALESGFLPDSPNRPEWPQPDCWLLPGQVYRQLTRWVFAPG
jgi:aldose 1-epimerase